MDSRQKKAKVPPELATMRIALSLLSRISPRLAAAAANQLWFKTRRFTEPRRETEWLRHATSKTIKVGKLTVQLYRWGDEQAKPVLLTHGWNGRASQLGQFAVSLAERGFQPIGFDAPGHGRSSGKQTNLPEISKVIHAIHQDTGNFAGAVTHSFGGLCLLHAITARKPVHTDKIVCIASPLDAESLVDYFAHVMKLRPEVTEIQKSLLQRKFGEDIWKKFSMLEMCQQTDIPALIIHDTEDRELPLSVGRKISEVWNGSEFLETRGLGHQRILRDKQVIAAAAEFLGGCRT